MKIIRNKTIIGIFCVLIGIVVGFVLLPKAQEQQEKTIRAVRVKQDVAAGMKLESAMLEAVTVPERAAPKGSAVAVESFLSRYAAIPLKTGDYLTSEKVRDTLVDPVAAAAEKGKQLVTVTLPNFAASVAGSLEPGDVVAVMYTKQETQYQQLGINPTAPQSSPESEEEGGESETPEPESSAPPTYQPTYQAAQTIKITAIPEELKYLEVCKVSAPDGTDAAVSRSKNEEPNRLPATITFYTTESQALKLAEIEQNGKLHITFLARGKDADVFIPASERVLAVEDESKEPEPEPEQKAVQESEAVVPPPQGKEGDAQ